MVRNIEPESQLVQVTSPQQLNAQTLSSLERLIDEAIARRSGGVVVNMAGVQAVDSAGLNGLIAMQKRLVAQGMRMELQHPNALLQDIFVATRLDTRFTMTHASTEGETRHG